MRIRNRYQKPHPLPDLSSPLPPSTAAAEGAAAPPVAATGGATGSKEGEAMAAAAGGALAHVFGGGCAGGEGRGLHPNGLTANPTTCLPFFPRPSMVTAAAESGDLLAPGPHLPATRDVLFCHGHGREVPKREVDGENGRDIGDAHSTDGNPPAPKSLCAEASEASVGHDGQKMLPSGAVVALAAAEAMVWWSDEDGKLSLKKRRGGNYHAARERTLRVEEEEEEEANVNVTDKTEMKQPKPNKSRRRRTDASRTTTMAAPAGSTTVLTSGGNGSIGGAPTATGDKYAGATERCCDDMVDKEEGADVVPVATAALVDGNRNGGNGNGNGKKRRSPAVLMEGSRCSRVNGRGWRCGQQTLVGYSLCEHHLGKGRLRSVSSVRCNGRARKKEEADGAVPSPPSPPWQLTGEDDDDEEEEKPGKRRRNMKIGMVKARSMSSLLHQPDHPAPITIMAPEPFPSSPSPPPSTCPVNSSSSTALRR